jgi:hypothetical protein
MTEKPPFFIDNKNKINIYSDRIFTILTYKYLQTTITDNKLLNTLYAYTIICTAGVDPNNEGISTLLRTTRGPREAERLCSQPPCAQSAICNHSL